MNAPQTAPTIEPVTNRGSFLHWLFPSFWQILANLPSSRVWIARTFCNSPGLIVSAGSLLAIVLFFKSMLVLSIFRDKVIRDWMHSRGGGVALYEDSSRSVRTSFPVFFGRPPRQGQLISSVTVSPQLVNGEEPELFSKISRLSNLNRLTIVPPEAIIQLTLPKPKPTHPTPDDQLIDSDRLQKGLASLSQAVALVIEDCRLTPCEEPLDLTHRISQLSIQHLTMTADFARGLPIVRKGSYVYVRDTTIDEAAVEILLERISHSSIRFSNCMMSAETHARLAAIRGVFITTPQIIKRPTTTSAEPPAATE